MIPRIIHYCWFGNKELSELELSCLESWKNVLFDFEFKLWNENSFDLKNHSFTRLAYDSGKYAFVSDYVRLFSLYEHGGIYMDTDMLVLKNFDDLFIYEFFTGEYRKGALNAAIIGAQPKSPVIKLLLEAYDKFEFNVLKLKTIPEVFDDVLWNSLDTGIKIFPYDFFYPLPLEKKGFDYSQFLSENSYTVHLWNHSWKDEFALLRENQFLASLFLSLRHLYCYPIFYRHKRYLENYTSQFKKHFMRYLKFKLNGKA